LGSALSPVADPIEPVGREAQLDVPQHERQLHDPAGPPVEATLRVVRGDPPASSFRGLTEYRLLDARQWGD
jgi:hypothetical protein